MRRFAIGSIAVAFATLSFAAFAQPAWPTKPIHMIVPFPAGGQLDVVALAVLEAPRYPVLPDGPTVVELGYPDLVMSTWFGLVVPRATPRPIVDRISAELMNVLAAPDVIDKVKAIGAEAAAPNSPEQFEQCLKGDVARWKRIVTDAAIDVD